MAIRQSAEQSLAVHGIELVAQTFGNPTDPPLLLIMGLGAQMVAWDDDFCRQLAARGYQVIRYDNRDTGRATWFDEAGTPDLLALFQAWIRGERLDMPAPYTLRDMAADAAGLLEALGHSQAHVVGISLGGMIAQQLAIHVPDRVRTLTLMMSFSGDLAHWSPDPTALALLLTPSPQDREAYIEHSVRVGRAFSGPGYPLDETRARRRAARAFDRGVHPQGTARHMAALVASLGWKSSLAGLRIPTLVIHGEADPIVPLPGGVDTAASIPGARLLTIPGLGHGLPPAVWPELIDAIAGHARD